MYNPHRQWLKVFFKIASKNAKIEDLRFHDLRHTAATRLVESSIPLHAVAKLLGHSILLPSKNQVELS
ncbi:MAG: tyrosine-type recombinase/integrase [Candidatus Dadabacteria bacterium]|nr:tyrosine-type recombinase/integrase [Candidatus Dadabacteria bacterium]